MQTEQLTKCFEPLQKQLVPFNRFNSDVFTILLVLVSVSVLVSPTMCLDDFT